MLGNEGMIQRRGASQAATFIIAASNSLHPERADFVCGGVDDNLIIQGVIDIAKDGDKILFLAGIYWFSDTVEQIDKSVTIEGEGHSWTDGGTLFYLTDGANCNMFGVSTTADEHSYFPTFRNFVLNGRNDFQTATGHGIRIFGTDSSYVSDIKIQDVGILNCKGHGIFLETGWLTSITDVWCECNVLDGLRAIDGQPKITNSNFLYNGGNGLYLSTNGSIVTATTIAKNDLNGIHCLTGAETIINGCGIGNNSYSSAGNASGILVSSGSRVSIVNNLFNGNSTEDHNISVYSTVTDALITDNQVWDSVGAAVVISAGATYQLRNNRGFATENSGTATLVNGQTSIPVAHGLAVTPVAGDIVVTPIEAWGNMTTFYIDTYTETHFTIRSPIDPGQDVDFAWKAIVL